MANRQDSSPEQCTAQFHPGGQLTVEDSHCSVWEQLMVHVLVVVLQLAHWAGQVTPPGAGTTQPHMHAPTPSQRWLVAQSSSGSSP